MNHIISRARLGSESYVRRGGLTTLIRCVHASLYEGLSVGRSVGPSVRRSVTRFFLIAEIDKKQHRIIGKVETLFLDCNNLQKILKQNMKTKF